MKLSYLNQFYKEFDNLSREICESFYYDDGSLIKQKDFGELTANITRLKKLLDETLNDCVEDMFGKRVTTSLGAGKVVSFELKAMKEGVLVYKVLLDNDKEEFFYDNELTLEKDN